MTYNLYHTFDLASKDKQPLIYQKGQYTWSYRDVDRYTARLCHYFRELGLSPGDRIMAQTEKSVEAWCVFLACLRYGLIYIPLNPAFQASELKYYLADAEPKLIVCRADQARVIKALSEKLNINLVITTMNKAGKGALDESLVVYPDHYDVVPLSPDTTACILYTSGTTGQPKGAMLSHKNLLTNAQDLVTAWGFTDQDVLLHTLPIFHCHGLFFALHSVLLSGASMVLLKKFEVESVIESLPECTVMMGVPTYYIRLLQHEAFVSAIPRKFRLFISGSAPLLESTFAEFEQATGFQLLERYGMTETGIICSNPLHHERIAGTVGLPLNQVQCRVVNDAGRLVTDNVTGHIQVKGKQVFRGYWRNTEKTAEAFTPDGYFRTGDIGVVNKASGYLSIVGRHKDMIITGGINVYPSEIEFLINKISGITESAVIGLPHPDLGEAVTAVVVVEPDEPVSEERIKGAVKLAMAGYKVPKKVIFIDSLPRNSMAKVMKQVLRDRFQDVYTLTRHSVKHSVAAKSTSPQEGSLE